MKTSKYFLFIIVAFIGFNVTSSHAQTRKQLEASRKKIKKDIERVNRLLFDSQKKGKNALEALDDINQKIVIRSAYINSINKESEVLSKEILNNEKDLKKLNNKLEKLKKDYANMIFKSYKSKSKQSQLLFLMSSKSFQQAYKRLQYMKQYTNFRKKQGILIAQQSNKITVLNDSLFVKKQVKDTLLKSQELEKQQIEVDKKDQEGLVKQIQKRSSRYKREIRSKQKEERKIANKIDAIIKAAIAKSNLNKTNKNAKGFALTPEAKALAKRFELNKGKLPWPVTNGLVVRRFGEQRHPTLSGITITSTGLHIATNKGTYAQSVFNGKVLAIQLLSGGKKAVLIQHGNYITTYNNLESLSVNKGDTVVTGQTIGKIFTNKVTKKTILIFVLHKETQRQNPSGWLLKR